MLWTCDVGAEGLKSAPVNASDIKPAEFKLLGGKASPGIRLQAFTKHLGIPAHAKCCPGKAAALGAVFSVIMGTGCGFYQFPDAATRLV